MRSAVIAGALLTLIVVLFVCYHVSRPAATAVPGLDQSVYTPAAVPGHVTTLKHQDPAERKRAARALWQIGVYAKEATPALLAGAKDPDPEVRAAVAQALGRTSQGTQDAVPALVQALQDLSADVRAAAAKSLAEIWVAAFVPASVTGDAPKRRAGQGDPAFTAAARSAIPALTAALQDADARVRAHAAEALVATGPLAQPAVDALLPLLKDADDNARLQATLALEGIGPGAKAAAPQLAANLREDKVVGIRVNSASALGRIHGHAEVAVPVLLHAALYDPEPEVRTWAMFGLDAFGPEAKSAVPAIRQAAGEPRFRDDPRLQQALSQLAERLEGKSPPPNPERRSGPPRGP
jgi:hypothetical protein